METRTCSLCGVAKPDDAFSWARGYLNSTRCKACLTQIRRAERAARPPKPPRLTEKDKTHKRCNVCEVEKPVSEFYWNQRRWSSACRLCITAAQRAQRAADPEAYRAYRRTVPSNQPEAKRTRYLANLDETRAYHRAWSQAKRDRNPNPKRVYKKGYTMAPEVIAKRRATLATRTPEQRQQTFAKLSTAKRAMWADRTPEERARILAPAHAVGPEPMHRAQREKGRSPQHAANLKTALQKLRKNPAWIAKMRAGLRGHWASKSWEERLEMTAQMRRKGSATQHSTSIERAVGAVLAEMGEPHEPQKRLAGLHVDFYLPSRNLAIECDGTYWHSRPGAAEKDAMRDERLLAHDYRVARLSEADIRRDARAAVMAALGTNGPP